MTKDKVEALHQQEISVNVWLGRHPMDYRELIDMGIDILISDNPDQVKEIISNL
ncbi:MAG: glycerophosphodiester phosphodiesterase family protein [Peptostreptococcaceae bacterium]